MGAGTLLAFSISMKEQKKTFVAERLEATLLKYGPQDLANPKFRLATRKLPMKEVIDLVSSRCDIPIACAECTNSTRSG